jgi:hypothetical protein
MYLMNLMFPMSRLNQLTQNYQTYLRNQNYRGYLNYQMTLMFQKNQ